MMKIDLSGQWQVKLDAEKQETMPQAYPETMTLPGTTSAAGLGMPNPAKETGCLTDAYRFEGAVWFMRTFTAGDWTGEQTMLTLERTRKTTVYLDGRPIGHQESLCTPHRYFLPPVHAGEHTLVIRVDNTDYPTRGGHLTSPDTQSNWNGITSEISLTVAHTLLTDLTVRPDLRRGCLRVHGHIIGAPDGVAGLVLPGQMEHLLPYWTGNARSRAMKPSGTKRTPKSIPSLLISTETCTKRHSACAMCGRSVGGCSSTGAKPSCAAKLIICCTPKPGTRQLTLRRG